MVAYGTDNYGLGYNLAAKAGVYPQATEFNTAVSPGANLAISALLGTSDTIGLFWIPTPGRLHGYAIDLGDLDQSAALVLILEDGAGNVYQSGITTGQAGGRLTDATARIGVVGQIDYLTPSLSFMRLRPSTAAGAGITAAAQINGTARYRQL